VQAVIQLPVKGEDSDEELFGHSEMSPIASPLAYAPPGEGSTSSSGRRTSTRVQTARKKKIVIHADEDYQPDDDVGGNNRVNSSDDSEGEDELMIRAEVRSNYSSTL
jgi:hypothetical protein